MSGEKTFALFEAWGARGEGEPVQRETPFPGGVDRACVEAAARGDRRAQQAVLEAALPRVRVIARALAYRAAIPESEASGPFRLTFSTG